jgi:hypothetical protein
LCCDEGQKKENSHTTKISKISKMDSFLLLSDKQTNEEERDLSRQKTTHNKDTPTHLQQQNTHQQWEKNRERRKQERKGRTNQIASN